MKKTKTLEVEVYENPDGEPTCGSDFRTGDVCQFILSQRYGTEYTCVFAANEVRGMKMPLSATDNGMGYLIPCKECPLHNK